MAIQIRRGNDAEWESNKSNIVAGEPAVTLDSERMFVGTGSGTYMELANLDVLADAFDSSASYEVGDFVAYHGKVYKCNTAHSGAWNASDFDEVALADALDSLGEDVYTKAEADALLALKANASDVNSALALKADKSDTYTKTEVNTALALKADKSDTYTKAETDNLIDQSVLYIDRETSSVTEETKLVFSNDNTYITADGVVHTDNSYALTDYIELDDVIGIYRTGTTIKFTLYRYAFYDDDKTLLSVANSTTDYEIVDYNGKQVTWLTMNPSAKYIRVGVDKSRPYEYFSVKDVGVVVDSYTLPKIIINNEDIYEDAIESKNTTEIVNEVTEQTSINILNPDDFKANGYYLDFTDGTTHIDGASQKMTADWIEIDQDYIYVIQTYSTTAVSIFLVYCYGENGQYLGYVTNTFAQWGSKFTVPLYDGTKYIRIFSNANDAITGDMLCITLDAVNEFVEYDPYHVIKQSALPKQKYLPLYGKVIANFGDSIFGNKRPPNDVSTSLANITGATVYNLGFGGCRMSQHSAGWDAFCMYRLAEAIATKDFTYQDSVNVDSVAGMPQYFKETRALLESIDFDKVDIITISYGTNDFTAGVALDKPNDYDDTTTFCGALRYSLEKILPAYPQLHVFVCTPTYRFWIDTENDNEFLYDSDTHEISGQLLTDFVEAVQDVSKAYHLKSIDNYYDLGIDKFNRAHWFPANDGTHHNKNGGMLIAQHMANEMF